MKEYKLYCNNESKWIRVISDTLPTKCPNDELHGVGNICINKPDDVEINAESLPTEVSLYNYKQLKFAEIDKRSGELIAQGFAYGGKTFPISKNSQLNLLGVEIKRNDGILPITFNTIDDMDDAVLTTPEEVDNFFMTALATKKGVLDSGTSLKLSVRNATTESEVDAIIDNR